MTADSVVVGAGFTGLSAALHLAEAGCSVVVLEGVDIGFGGSGRNAGLVNAGMWMMPDDVEDALGKEYGGRLLNMLSDAPSLVFELIEKHTIACEIERNGTLHCAVGRHGFSELEERARQWHARGAPVHLLNAAQTARLVGSNAYAGSLLDLRAGTIQPLAYARGLAVAALKTGAKIFTSSPVLDAIDLGNGWLVHTKGGSVRAKWVIVGTNAYTSDMWPQIRKELVHLPYFNLATAPLSEDLCHTILPGRQGVWDTKKVLSSFRRDHHRRLVFGSVGALRGAGQTIHPKWGHRALKKLFPQLTHVEFEYEWYGSIGLTTDSLPRFHRLARNVFSFSGYNGRGIAPGTAFGRALARLVLGDASATDPALPMTEPMPIRCRAAKEAYYKFGSEIAHAVAARF